MADISTYSPTDDSNNAAPPAGFPEGQSPASLNDSARAVMGAVRRSWERVNATVTATGSSNAYVITYTISPGSYVTGEVYRFVANFSNTSAATLAINALAAKAIVDQAGAALVAGAIPNGSIVSVAYNGTAFQLLTSPAVNFTGDATGVGAGSIALTLANSGVTAGTYNSVTVNAKGLVTAATTTVNEPFVSSAAAPVSGVLDISAIAGNFIDITATAMGSITGLGSLPAGARRTLRFSGAAPGILVNGGLVLPNGANITLAQYDILTFRSFGGAVWQLEGYVRYSGLPLNTAAIALMNTTSTGYVNVTGSLSAGTAIGAGTTIAAGTSIFAGTYVQSATDVYAGLSSVGAWSSHHIYAGGTLNWSWGSSNYTVGTNARGNTTLINGTPASNGITGAAYDICYAIS